MIMKRIFLISLILFLFILIANVNNALAGNIDMEGSNISNVTCIGGNKNDCILDFSDTNERYLTSNYELIIDRHTPAIGFAGSGIPVIDTDKSLGQLRINPTGTKHSSLYLNPTSLDQTGNTNIGFFRYSDTSNDANFYIYKGDGTPSTTFTIDAHTGNITKLGGITTKTKIIQSKTSGALAINQLGVLDYGQQAVSIYSNAAQNNEHLLRIYDDSPDSTKRTVEILSDAAVCAQQDVMHIQATNAANDRPVLQLVQQGVGQSLAVDQNGDGIGIDIDSEATTKTGINIQDMSSNKSITIQTGDKICMDGNTCSAYLVYNGSCIISSNGGCI